MSSVVFASHTFCKIPTWPRIIAGTSASSSGWTGTRHNLWHQSDDAPQTNPLPSSFQFVTRQNFEKFPRRSSQTPEVPFGANSFPHEDSRTFLPAHTWSALLWLSRVTKWLMITWYQTRHERWSPGWRSVTLAQTTSAEGRYGSPLSFQVGQSGETRVF